MSIEFTEVPVPKMPAPQRDAEPNPFDDSPLITALVAELAKPKDERTAKRFTVARPAKDDDAKALVRKLKRQLSDAAATHGLTVRTVIEPTGTAKAPTFTVDAWGIPRIVRPRKAAPQPGTDAPESPAGE
jgi:hypothetical protein